MYFTLLLLRLISIPNYCCYITRIRRALFLSFEIWVEKNMLILAAMMCHPLGIVAAMSWAQMNCRRNEMSWILSDQMDVRGFFAIAALLSISTILKGKASDDGWVYHYMRDTDRNRRTVNDCEYSVILLLLFIGPYGWVIKETMKDHDTLPREIIVYLRSNFGIFKFSDFFKIWIPMLIRTTTQRSHGNHCP